MGIIIYVLEVSNGVIIQFGIVRNVSCAATHTINFPTAYTCHYIGMTDMTGNLNNGVVLRFNPSSLTQFIIGYDVPATSYCTVSKFWLSIGY